MSNAPDLSPTFLLARLFVADKANAPARLLVSFPEQHARRLEAFWGLYCGTLYAGQAIARDVFLNKKKPKKEATPTA